MLFLTSAESLSINMSAAPGTALTVRVSYADVATDGTTFAPGSALVSVSASGATTLVAAPAASTIRQIKSLAIHNPSVVGAPTFNLAIGATDILTAFSVGGRETLQYADTAFRSLRPDGSLKTYNATGAGKVTKSVPLQKTGTAPEAVGNWYSFGKDAGLPGAWSPGTPGLAGRATLGTAAPDAGCLAISPPAGDATYSLRGLNVHSTLATYLRLVDIMWVNSGIVVTTLTAQTINSVALPARDRDGTTAGLDVYAGILVTAATTNAAATAPTISYTNSDGVAGRTGTATIPATAVIGTVIPFNLAAGDRGVRSIQSITLNTTLTAGSISLIMFRSLKGQALLANTSIINTPNNDDDGITIWTGACIIPFIIATSTTAFSIFGDVEFTYKAA